jgi:hypothetical protein
MKRLLSASLVAVVCAVAAVSGLGAQATGGRAQGTGGRAAQPAAAAATQRNWYSVSIFTVKPERARDFVELMKTETIPMQQKAGVKFRDTWQSGAPFGDAFTYGVVTSITNFAEYDQPPLATRMLGDAARSYTEKLASMLVSRRTFAVQDRAELSMPPAANAKFVAAILQDATVISGHAEQFEAYIKNDMMPVLKKADTVGYTISRTVFGGDANEYHSVTYLSSFAEIDKGPGTVRVLGQAGAAALAAKGAAHISKIERTILRYVPDLSFRATPTS